jgi:lipid-binding SYLF domain-containing protein
MDRGAISNGTFTGKRKYMFKHLLMFSIILLVAAPFALASDREDDVARTEKAAQVLKQIMVTPDQAIPHDLLGSAKCIAIIPGDKKFAFIFGGNYGRGVATCRTVHGSLSPLTEEASDTRLVAPLRTWLCSS